MYLSCSSCQWLLDTMDSEEERLLGCEDGVDSEEDRMGLRLGLLWILRL